jgi:hypothetical protein
MIFIISYRKEWEQRCFRSCNCLRHSSSSDLEIKHFENEELATDYIVGRIRGNPDAEYSHYIATSWDDILSFCNEGTSTDWNSIAWSYENEASDRIYQKVKDELSRQRG